MIINTIYSIFLIYDTTKLSLCYDHEVDAVDY